MLLKAGQTQVFDLRQLSVTVCASHPFHFLQLSLDASGLVESHEHSFAHWAAFNGLELHVVTTGSLGNCQY